MKLGSKLGIAGADNVCKGLHKERWFIQVLCQLLVLERLREEPEPADPRGADLNPTDLPVPARQEGPLHGLQGRRPLHRQEPRHWDDHPRLQGPLQEGA